MLCLTYVLMDMGKAKLFYAVLWNKNILKITIISSF